jgi:hypothetical protein
MFKCPYCRPMSPTRSRGRRPSRPPPVAFGLGSLAKATLESLRSQAGQQCYPTIGIADVQWFPCTRESPATPRYLGRHAHRRAHRRRHTDTHVRDFDSPEAAPRHHRSVPPWPCLLTFMVRDAAATAAASVRSCGPAQVARSFSLAASPDPPPIHSMGIRGPRHLIFFCRLQPPPQDCTLIESRAASRKMH